MGPAGATGATGPTGPQGLTGPTGPMGLSGGGQLFTASGTYTVPAGITALWVRAQGGGAGDNSLATFAAGSGGEGGMVIAVVPVEPGDVVTLIVGAGGSGSQTAGANGGTSSVAIGSPSPIVLAFGGSGGQPNNGGGTPTSSGGSFFVALPAEGVTGQVGAASTSYSYGSGQTVSVPGGQADFFGTGGTGGADESGAPGQNGLGGLCGWATDELGPSGERGRGFRDGRHGDASGERRHRAASSRDLSDAAGTGRLLEMGYNRQRLCSRRATPHAGRRLKPYDPPTCREAAPCDCPQP